MIVHMVTITVTHKNVNNRSRIRSRLRLHRRKHRPRVKQSIQNEELTRPNQHPPRQNELMRSSKVTKVLRRRRPRITPTTKTTHITRVTNGTSRTTITRLQNSVKTTKLTLNHHFIPTHQKGKQTHPRHPISKVIRRHRGINTVRQYPDPRTRPISVRPQTTLTQRVPPVAISHTSRHPHLVRPHPHFRRRHRQQLRVKVLSNRHHSITLIRMLSRIRTTQVRPTNPHQRNSSRRLTLRNTGPLRFNGHTINTLLQTINLNGTRVSPSQIRHKPTKRSNGHTNIQPFNSRIAPQPPRHTPISRQNHTTQRPQILKQKKHNIRRFLHNNRQTIRHLSRPIRGTITDSSRRPRHRGRRTQSVNHTPQRIPMGPHPRTIRNPLSRHTPRRRRYRSRRHRSHRTQRVSTIRRIRTRPTTSTILPIPHPHRTRSRRRDRQGTHRRVRRHNNLPTRSQRLSHPPRHLRRPPSRMTRHHRRPTRRPLSRPTTQSRQQHRQNNGRHGPRMGQRRKRFRGPSPVRTTHLSFAHHGLAQFQHGQGRKDREAKQNTQNSITRNLIPTYHTFRRKTTTFRGKDHPYTINLPSKVISAVSATKAPTPNTLINGNSSSPRRHVHQQYRNPITIPSHTTHHAAPITPAADEHPDPTQAPTLHPSHDLQGYIISDE